MLPSGYVRRLRRYRYGPAVFKIDWALDGPIPWRDPAVLEASTVHVGGSLDDMTTSERAPWNGEHADQRMGRCSAANSSGNNRHCGLQDGRIARREAG